MASLQVSKIDNRYGKFKLHLDVDGKSYGTITINDDEVDKTKINDPLYQQSIIREFIHRRES
jgi:hypothetical protein